MRDQPLKRFLTRDPNTPKQAYKYQHYYDSTKSNTIGLNKSLNTQSSSLIQPVNYFDVRNDQRPSLATNLSVKNSLRGQIDNVKSQVQAIMGRNKEINRLPLLRKLSKDQDQLKQLQSKTIDNCQQGQTPKPVKQQFLLIQPSKKQIQRPTLDINKFLQIESQNSKLKKQLRNLQVDNNNRDNLQCQKCIFLEKKIIQLEALLIQKQKGFSKVATIKEQQLEQVKKILNSLQKDLSEKDQKINQKQSQLEELSKDAAKSKDNFQQQTKTIKQIEAKYLQDKGKLNIKIENLEKFIEEQKSYLQNTINSLKNENENMVHYIENQKSQFDRFAYEINQEKDMLEHELIYFRGLNQDKNTMKNSQTEIIQKIAEVQDYFRQQIENIERNNQQQIKFIKQEYEENIIAIKSEKRQSQKGCLSNEQNLQKQLQKWKVQYKILLERHQSYLNNENKNKSQLKQYYKTYRQSKQKIEILTYKNRHLEKEFEKYIKILTVKDNQIVRKQIEVRKKSNEMAMSYNKFTRQIIGLNDKLKRTQQKYLEEIQRGNKQVNFRKQIQEKLYLKTTDEDVRQIIEKLKKRMIEQDQKLSKNVKQIKNKDTTISNLKQELKELMETLDDRVQQQKNKQIEQLITNHMTKDNEIFSLYKEKSQEESRTLMQHQDKLLEEILQFKLENCQKEQKIIEIQSQLKAIINSYNNKNIEVDQILHEKETLIDNLKMKLEQQLDQKNRMETLLRSEINSYVQQISLLRSQSISRRSVLSPSLSFNASFDQILKNQIEENDKLRSQASKKVEEIYKVRDNYSTLKLQYDNLRSENDLNKLKFLSQKNNIEVASQIQIDGYKSQMNGFLKKNSILEQKIQIIVEQSKKKDSFIQSYIMGRKINDTEKETAVDFIKQYQIVMGSQDINNRLLDQHHQILNLQNHIRHLMNEISSLKQKLLLNEVSNLDINMYKTMNLNGLQQQASQFRNIRLYDSRNGNQCGESKLKKTISVQNIHF